jgi:hypothetical protein
VGLISKFPFKITSWLFTKIKFVIAHFDSVRRFDEWMNPRGLHVDEQSNIYTVALKTRKNYPKKGQNARMFLYIIGSNGVLRQRLDLKTTQVYDFCVSNDKFVFIQYGKSLPILSIMDIS